MNRHSPSKANIPRGYPRNTYFLLWKEAIWEVIEVRTINYSLFISCGIISTFRKKTAFRPFVPRRRLSELDFVRAERCFACSYIRENFVTQRGYRLKPQSGIKLSSIKIDDQVFVEFYKMRNSFYVQIVINCYILTIPPGKPWVQKILNFN